MTKKYNFKKALVLGGSSGIGKAISKELMKSCKFVKSFSSKDLDTSNYESIKIFQKKYKSTDVLILNSGGPPPLSFQEISKETWEKYFYQLFLGFCLILKEIKINRNGYIFYISSSIIKEPSENLILSSSLRVGFSSVLKSLSKSYSKKGISVINIAPGPFKTKRVKNLITNLKKYENSLPSKKIGNPKEIGIFINSIVNNKIKYISGSTVYFDGNILNSFF